MGYTDDPEEQIYEIRRLENEEKFLVLTMTVVRVSFAMDEVNLYDNVDVALELMADNMHSSSRINNLWLSVALTVAIIIAFFGFVFTMVLPTHFKK